MRSLICWLRCCQAWRSLPTSASWEMTRKAYFLGLPATGQPDDRAGDISDAQPEPVNRASGIDAKTRGSVMTDITPLGDPLVTGAAVAFWSLAPVMILSALGMILARKPVHSAYASRR